MLISDFQNKIYQKACKRESEFWDWHDDYDFEIPKKVQEYENLMKYWDQNIDDIDFLKNLWIFQRGLSLGAGWWTFELNLLEYGIVEQFHFIDISEDALTTLRHNATRRWLQGKITTEIQDINFISLPSESFEFVSIINALHHVINLEELIFEVNKSLTGGWVFYTKDVICEQKMFWSDIKVSLMETFIVYMRSKNINLRPFIRTNPKILTNNCPFECIRSHELESVLLYYFDRTTILHSTYRPLFFAWSWLIDSHRNIQDIYLQELQRFDSFAYEQNICQPNRLLWVYRKSNLPLKTVDPLNIKEMERYIWVSLISEKFLMAYSYKFIAKFPSLYSFLKKIYFMIRK